MVARVMGASLLGARMTQGLATVTVVIVTAGLGRLAPVRRGEDRVGDLHPRRDVADDLVRVVVGEQVAGLVGQDDEELRADRVGLRAARHRDHAAAVLGRDGLVLDRVAGAAAAGARRVAALDHERRAASSAAVRWKTTPS